ncbi:hypothetical protein JOB18_018844 [Solea senegalensis]|uniref:TRIM8/14/16/25/29/45/65 coiled-coil region domain-containing protein n=1 Tax=Solea senegalensis TaxID=28829 RepID=A0AAV6PAE4_SOLSE|nr:hypothetical protein JOB18_018844 [Solea senegalensis]
MGHMNNSRYLRECDFARFHHYMRNGLYTQTQLSDMKKNSLLQIQLREKDAQELRHAIFSLTRSARTAANEIGAVFKELIRSMELKPVEARELIKAQEKMADLQAEQLLGKIQREIAALKKNEAEQDKLSQAADHIHFLQGFQSLHAPPELSALPPVIADPNLTFGLHQISMDYCRKSSRNDWTASVKETLRSLGILVQSLKQHQVRSHICNWKYGTQLGFRTGSRVRSVSTLTVPEVSHGNGSRYKGGRIPDKKKYDAVKAAFEQHYIGKHNIIFERAQFSSRRQRDGETVEAYFTAVHKLAENCGFGVLKEELIRDRIVVGIRDEIV